MAMNLNLKPLGDRVLVEPAEEKEVKKKEEEEQPEKETMFVKAETQTACDR